jgi:trehalose 2-sulfotransferase
VTQFSKPTKAYLVCATPRSGSTLLCEMLRETGRAGVPLEHFEILRHSSLPRQPREYFQDLDAPHVVERLAPAEAGTASTEAAVDWWARILADGSTGNGVWGGKIMWGHTEDFVARARELPRLAGADLDAVLRELLDDPELVFVTRRDKAAQAVSLWRAVQTQSWRFGEAPAADSVAYEFEAIDHLVSQLESDERSWSEWFARTGRKPLEVTYDRLDSAAAQTVELVLHALGLPDGEVTVPRLARQRDDLSAAWIERYRQERGKAA